MEKKLKFLPVSAIIFKVLAWVSLALGIISGIVILVGGGTADTPRSTGAIGMLLGLGYLFIFLTTSQVISLLLEIRSKLDKGPAA